MSLDSPIITVEISSHPLHQDYKQRVDEFLYRLYSYHDLKIETSMTCTWLIGPSARVFEALQTEILESFKTGQNPFILKVYQGDLSAMEIPDYQ